LSKYKITTLIEKREFLEILQERRNIINADIIKKRKLKTFPVRR
jgi:hypothetical protein